MIIIMYIKFNAKIHMFHSARAGEKEAYIITHVPSKYHNELSTHTHTHAHTHARMHTCMHACTHARMHAQ